MATFGKLFVRNLVEHLQWAAKIKIKRRDKPTQVESSDAFELTKEEFKDRLKNSFASVYLTTISIIQGVALGILAFNTFSCIKGNNYCEFLEVLPYSMISLLTIMVVSYEYTWFVGVFRWPPRIWDTIVPFALGFLEVSPMYHLKDPANWWLWTALFSFMGAGAFWNSLWNCKEDMFGSLKEAHKITREELKGDIEIAVITGCFGLAISVIFMFRFSFANILSYLGIIFYLLIITLLMKKGEKFMANLKKIYKIPN